MFWFGKTAEDIKRKVREWEREKAADERLDLIRMYERKIEEARNEVAMEKNKEIKQIQQDLDRQKSVFFKFKAESEMIEIIFTEMSAWAGGLLNNYAAVDGKMKQLLGRAEWVNRSIKKKYIKYREVIENRG